MVKLTVQASSLGELIESLQRIRENLKKNVKMGISVTYNWKVED